MTPDGDLLKDLLPLEVSNKLCDAEVSTYFGFYRTIVTGPRPGPGPEPEPTNQICTPYYFIVFSIVLYRTFDRVFHRTLITVLFENRMSIAILFII